MDIGIFLFFAALSLLVLTSLGMISIFGFNYLVEQVISFLVVISANIVLAAFILSFFKSITPFGFLIVHIIFLFTVFLIIKSSGKNFFPPFPKADLGKFNELKKHPPILLLAIPFSAFLVVSIFLILFVPPNNWDSMTYHLSRIGFWLQNNAMDFFKTYNFRQNSLPPNAEILIMWTVTFIKSDLLAGFIQWIGYLGTIVLIYGIALELGSTHFQGIFAGLVWASIPEVMLEATSTQNDIVGTFFLMASIFFMLRGNNKLGWQQFVVSGISVGLAVGAKGTSVFALPGVFIGTLFLFYKRGNNFRINLAILSASAFIGIIIFGSYIYIYNYLYYGYPFAPKAAVATLTNPNLGNMFSNLYHILYRFLDTSGIPLIKIPGFYPTPPIHEDFAGYGLTWLVLGIPAFFYALYKGFFKKDFLKAYIFIIAAGYLLMFSLALTANPYLFRLLIFFTAIICPLIAFIYPKDIHWNWQKIVFIGVAVLGAIQIFATVFSNISKPVYFLWEKTGFEIYRLGDKKSFFDMDFYEKRFMVHGRIPEMVIFKELDKMAKIGDRIGIIASGDDWDYPAFGKRFERIVIPIVVKDEKPNVDVFAKYNLDFLIAYTPIQGIENNQTNIMPFLEHLVKQRGSTLSILRAGHILLFVKNAQ